MKAVRAKHYFGGIHPRAEKKLSSGQPIETAPLPQTVAVSCTQSAGCPAEPVVQTGQTVKEGELIAKAAGAVSSDAFASVCGTVSDIRDLTGTGGKTEKFIFIQSDGKKDKAYLPPLQSPSPEEIKQRIKDCGIVGLGGAGFPTAVKVSPTEPVDTLIINGAECEPYLTCDYRLMLEHADEIVRGARYVATALGAENLVIGIEANKRDCAEKFEPFDDLKVVLLKKKYPLGGEKQLIYCTTGKKLGRGKLPFEIGVVVQNVATCFAVCQAIELGKPLYERVVTVSGRAVKTPKNVLVRIGTPIEELIAFCGGEISRPKKAVLGGPMTGVALANYDGYVHKTTSGIVLMTEDEACTEEPTPCLNCGKCADVCPMHLMPMNTAFYSAAGDFEAAAKYGNVRSCIECGACEYICPARRPLIQAIRKTKAALRAAEKGEKND